MRFPTCLYLCCDCPGVWINSEDPATVCSEEEEGGWERGGGHGADEEKQGWRDERKSEVKAPEIVTGNP